MVISGDLLGHVDGTFSVYHDKFDYLVEWDDKGEAIGVYNLNPQNINWVNKGLADNGYPLASL